MIRKIDKEELLEIISEAVATSKSITGFPSELPVGVDRTKALTRYSQEMSSLEAQIRSASTSAEKQGLEGELQDVTDEHEALSKSADAAITEASGILELRKIFKENDLSIEDRIETLELLLKNFFSKDSQGAGYVERLSSIEKDIEAVKHKMPSEEEADIEKVI